MKILIVEIKICGDCPNLNSLAGHDYFCLKTGVGGLDPSMLDEGCPLHDWKVHPDMPDSIKRKTQLERDMLIPDNFNDPEEVRRRKYGT